MNVEDFSDKFRIIQKHIVENSIAGELTGTNKELANCVILQVVQVQGITSAR